MENNNDKSYQFSGSIGKNIVKETVQGVIEGLNTYIPSLVGGMGGAGLGTAIINKSGSLPPVQKAALGVATAVGGALGLTIATGVGREINKNFINKSEVNNGKASSDSSGSSGSSGSSSTAGPDKSAGNVSSDDNIPSILEFGENVSPLQALLNYEIVIGLLILFHMIILILILFNKLYVSGSIKIFSKLVNKNILIKYEKYKVMIETLGSRVLIILFIINVVFLLGYIILLIYINIELSTNLDDYINVHTKMNQSNILLLVTGAEKRGC